MPVTLPRLPTSTLELGQSSNGSLSTHIRRRVDICFCQSCCKACIQQSLSRLLLCAYVDGFSDFAGHGLDLSQNAFGNYVVQYILDTGVAEACDLVLGQLQVRCLQSCNCVLLP